MAMQDMILECMWYNSETCSQMPVETTEVTGATRNRKLGDIDSTEREAPCSYKGSVESEFKGHVISRPTALPQRIACVSRDDKPD